MAREPFRPPCPLAAVSLGASTGNPTLGQEKPVVYTTLVETALSWGIGQPQTA
jgi:hypothetical protein